MVQHRLMGVSGEDTRRPAETDALEGAGQLAEPTRWEDLGQKAKVARPAFQGRRGGK